MLKVGTIIRQYSRDKITKEEIVRKYKVIKSYPHMVLCEDARGFKRCFSYGDLIVKKMVKQSPELELLKDQLNEHLRRIGEPHRKKYSKK